MSYDPIGILWYLNKVGDRVQIALRAPSIDKYARVSKVGRAEGALQSILKIQKIDGG